jgi:hypothetical protein
MGVGVNVGVGVEVGDGVAVQAAAVMVATSSADGPQLANNRIVVSIMAKNIRFIIYLLCTSWNFTTSILATIRILCMQPPSSLNSPDWYLTKRQPNIDLRPPIKRAKKTPFT